MVVLRPYLDWHYHLHWYVDSEERLILCNGCNLGGFGVPAADGGTPDECTDGLHSHIKQNKASAHCR